MLALTLLLLATTPTVHVDARGLAGLPPADAAKLHGQLLERLLEAGYAIHPAAPLTLSLEVERGGLVIRILGQGVAREDRTPLDGRDSTVVQLDAIHRSLALLDEVATPSEVEALPDGIVLRIESDASGLRGDVLRTLADERRTVVPEHSSGATWSLCGTRDPDGVRLAMTPVAEDCSAALADAASHDDIAVAFERAWNGARWPEDVEPDEPATSDADAPVVERVAKVEPPRPSFPPQPRNGRLRLLLQARAGLAVRPALDGAYGLGVGLGRERGPLGTLEATVMPSRGEVGLRVVDSTTVATFGWQFPVAAQFDLIPGAGAGLRLHTYWFADENARTLVDPELQLAMQARWRPRKRVHLGLRIAGAWSGRSRVHLNQGGTIWVRNAFRFDAAVEVVFGIPLRRR